MKKVILSLSLVIGFCVAAMAQITITQSNAPTAGNIAVTYSDTNYIGKTVGNAGANQLWNFSTWTNHTQSIEHFVNPSTLTGFSNFPTANLGVLQEDGTEVYFNSSSTSFNTLGVFVDYTGNADFIPLKYNPSDKNITFPSTYNTTFTGTYNFNISIAYSSPPIDSIRVVSSVAYNSVVDGWGTINTPSHSNVPCLRQKVRKITNNTIYVHYIVWIPSQNTVDTTYDYNWWSNSYNTMVARMQTDSAGTVTLANWLGLYVPEGVSEVNPKAVKDLKVFPNPSSSQTTITFSPLKMEGELEVYNTLGQLVYTEKLAKGSFNTEINIENFKNGLYKVILRQNAAIVAQESLLKN